jgi:hypothetical protein
MFTNPHLSSELANERRREMLAHAEQQRLAQPFIALARASRQRQRAERRMGRALRKAVRLRTELGH